MLRFAATVLSLLALASLAASQSYTRYLTGSKIHAVNTLMPTTDTWDFNFNFFANLSQPRISNATVDFPTTTDSEWTSFYLLRYPDAHRIGTTTFVKSE